MKLGAESRKIALLAGLLAVAAYFYFSGASDTGPAYVPRTPSQPAPVARVETTTLQRAARTAMRARTGRTGVQEFRPSLKARRPEDRPDPMTIDPTLRLDLLAKLQQVRVDGVKRSLFDFAKAPLPKAPEPKIIPKDIANTTSAQKKLAEQAAAKKKTKPPPPPIKLKFYGYISQARSSNKRGFFLDGEDIFVAGEGDIIQKRYKIVRIGVNSAVVEDTEHDHEQTLALVEQKG